MIILFPMTFLSNAFVPVNTVPDWLKWFANMNPISHLITAIRDLVNHGAIHGGLWLIVLGAMVIITISAWSRLW